MKTKNKKLGVKIATAIAKSDDLTVVTKALADVLGESFKGRIRHIEIEMDPKELRFGDQPWSGNIYRYSF